MPTSTVVVATAAAALAAAVSGIVAAIALGLDRPLETSPAVGFERNGDDGADREAVIGSGCDDDGMRPAK